MQTPHESHWKATKRILCYVHGTVQYGIHYSLGGTPLLVGFTNSDWAGNPNHQKSTTGYVFSFSSGPVTWACKKQQAIALSSAEAEYQVAVMQVRKPCGFDRSFQSLDSSTNIQPAFGVTIRVSSSLPKTQFNISIENTSSYTCTSSESSFMIKLLKCFFSLQKIKLQTFSQSLL